MKIRTIPVRKLRSLLLKLGFEEERGAHHVFFYLRHQGVVVVRTKISHGATEIGQPILGLIGKQLKLGRRDFSNLLQGRLTREEYLQILQGKRLIR